MAAHGSITNYTDLPSDAELTVPQELTVPHMVLRAGSFHLGKYCDRQMKEFILCRNETADPRKCLKEGADVTSCGVEFFRSVKKLCRAEFEDYLYCVDHRSGFKSGLQFCRKPQRVFDKCMLDNLNLERPPIGYFSVVRIHDSDRPKPEPPKFRDYKAEAAAFQNELPDDYPIREEYKRYQQGYGSLFY